ncbi:TPA: hypothetical protein ACGY7R_000309 [Stenotrophomonas maltophilia]
MDQITSCFVLETDWTAWGAIGTFFAAVVALLIAGYSEKSRLRDAEVRARVLAKIVWEDMRYRYINVLAASILLQNARDVVSPKADDVEAGSYAKSATDLMSSLDHGNLDELIPLSRVLGDQLNDRIANCYSQISAIKMRSKLVESGVDQGATAPEKLLPWVEGVRDSLIGLIGSIGAFLCIREEEDLEAIAEQRAEEVRKRLRLKKDLERTARLIN